MQIEYTVTIDTNENTATHTYKITYDPDTTTANVLKLQNWIITQGGMEGLNITPKMIVDSEKGQIHLTYLSGSSQAQDVQMAVNQLISKNFPKDSDDLLTQLTQQYKGPTSSIAVAQTAPPSGQPAMESNKSEKDSPDQSLATSFPAPFVKSDAGVTHALFIDVDLITQANSTNGSSDKAKTETEDEQLTRILSQLENVQKQAEAQTLIVLVHHEKDKLKAEKLQQKFKDLEKFKTKQTPVVCESYDINPPILTEAIIKLLLAKLPQGCNTCVITVSSSPDGQHLAKQVKALTTSKVDACPFTVFFDRENAPVNLNALGFTNYEKAYLEHYPSSTASDELKVFTNKLLQDAAVGYQIQWVKKLAQTFTYAKRDEMHRLVIENLNLLLFRFVQDLLVATISTKLETTRPIISELSVTRVFTDSIKIQWPDNATLPIIFFRQQLAELDNLDVGHRQQIAAALTEYTTAYDKLLIEIKQFESVREGLKELLKTLRNLAVDKAVLEAINKGVSPARDAHNAANAKQRQNLFMPTIAESRIDNFQTLMETFKAPITTNFNIEQVQKTITSFIAEHIPHIDASNKLKNLAKFVLLRYITFLNDLKVLQQQFIHDLLKSYDQSFLQETTSNAESKEESTPNTDASPKDSEKVPVISFPQQQAKLQALKQSALYDMEVMTIYTKSESTQELEQYKDAVVNTSTLFFATPVPELNEVSCQLALHDHENARDPIIELWQLKQIFLKQRTLLCDNAAKLNMALSARADSFKKNLPKELKDTKKLKELDALKELKSDLQKLKELKDDKLTQKSKEKMRELETKIAALEKDLSKELIELNELANKFSAISFEPACFLPQLEKALFNTTNSLEAKESVQSLALRLNIINVLEKIVTELDTYSKPRIGLFTPGTISSITKQIINSVINIIDEALKPDARIETLQHLVSSKMPDAVKKLPGANKLKQIYLQAATISVTLSTDAVSVPSQQPIAAPGVSGPVQQ